MGLAGYLGTRVRWDAKHHGK